MNDTFERAARFGLGLGLRALARLDASEWAERAGVRPRIHELTRRAAERVPTGGSGSSRGPSRRFDLTPTEDQTLMRDMVRRFGREAMTPIAGEADDAMRIPDDVFAIAGELDWLSAGIDESDGGEGERSATTSALIYEALGAGDMGMAVALLASTSAAFLIADHGSDSQKARWLPELMRGNRMALGVEPGTCRAIRRGTSWVLRGRTALVPDVAGATRFLLHATFDGKPKLAIVDRAAVEATPVPTMGLRAANLGRLELRETPVLDVIDADLNTVVARARIAWSALAVGQCQALLDYVIPFCNDRIAFGEPISHKQSIAFLLADLAIELEGMRLMTWRAASRADFGLEHVREAFLAHLQCTEKGVWSGTTGVQLLGGAGFIKDHPVERWYRHLRALGTIEGLVYA